MKDNMSGEVFLNDRWTLYFHDPNDEKWDIQSYKEIGSMSTVQEFINAAASFHDLWSKGMFFLMREHIRPMWEDDNNKDGGCFSYKIMKPEVPEAWFQLCAKCLGETILDPKIRAVDFEKVCGVSISPKKNYCILRIWVSDADTTAHTVEVPSYTTVLYKSHLAHKKFET